MDREIERRKIQLDERRLDEELKLKNKELALQSEQFEASLKRGGMLGQISGSVAPNISFNPTPQ